MLVFFLGPQNFADASKILLQGAQEMSGGLKDQQEDINQKDFHSELMSLRQRWRLKRSGNLIIGDLSYKSGYYYLFYFTVTMTSQSFASMKIFETYHLLYMIILLMWNTVYQAPGSSH